MPVEPFPLVFPSGCFAGAYFVHELRCPAVGNRVLRTPISARCLRRRRGRCPWLVQAFRRGRERGQLRLVCSSTASISASIPSIRPCVRAAENGDGHQAICERLFEFGDLLPHTRPCQLGEHFRVRLRRRSARPSSPAGDPENVRGDHGELDARVIDEFFDAVRSQSESDRIDQVALQIPHWRIRSAAQSWAAASAVGDFASQTASTTSFRLPTVSDSRVDQRLIEIVRLAEIDHRLA